MCKLNDLRKDNPILINDIFCANWPFKNIIFTMIRIKGGNFFVITLSEKNEDWNFFRINEIMKRILLDQI